MGTEVADPPEDAPHPDEPTRRSLVDGCAGPAPCRRGPVPPRAPRR
ncbi:hypothetical protein SAMN05660464_1047 [Geodermatophilus dictyosporus]|uniref:Uncharacterized protein n=1 Tax=Geodermatophilus dictyosporus TaxID=1523247 RepID=A0A1I5JUF4_9ACTN|nr:hypothetical protein SAMN05660464_1047 [Geodermatophilus dictyosporus]